MGLGEQLKYGSVPYRWVGNTGFEVLMISSRKDPSRWIFPKGTIEPDEGPQQVVLRETEEEAGVTGSVQERLHYETVGKQQTMFLLQVHSHVENWLEVTNSHQFDAKYPNLISSSAQERERSRRWMSVEEAFLVAKQMRYV
uniref:Nudix hydrolase domain-containing protein n=2 Tax=Rhodosorus marinus TaxID=101924 RepID=A0A7S3A0P3_9RHOD|mmetsp:Transcript_40203/g.159760  ORF Transcript_40203/g.159760 Transcript_40203/m.159760 type:complete len:141 (+) Transcript_40203:800-1222(+)